MSKPPTTSPWVVEYLPTDELLLDPHNPRLSDYGVAANPSQTEILRVLWSKMAVDEVALSIVENGFYSHEPLYAAKEGRKVYVIEGNRRLAAVKLIRDEALRRELKITSLPLVSEARIRLLDQLPVIVCKRDEIWAYLGFKHINGPQSWESYPKANYVAWVHNELKISLEEIARRIGDTHSTVARLYEGLMVLVQAEKAGVFDRNDRYREHFSFSHLTTGLGYSGIQEFLGLPKGEKIVGSRRPVPADHERSLGEFLLWLYGSKSKAAPPIVQSQNPDLRRLSEVLESKQATAALRKGLGLSVSLEISKGDDRVFREALVTAKQSLQKARGTVLSGYSGSQDLRQTAEDILELSQSLLEDMTPDPAPKPSRKK